MKKEELITNGKDTFMKVWLRKWEFLDKGIKSCIKVVIAISVLTYMAMFGISAFDHVASPENGEAIEIYENPNEYIWRSIVELDEENGNVVYIGQTISKEKAIQMARDNANAFNHLVSEKYANVAEGISHDVPKNFKNYVEVYWAPYEEAIFIVSRGTKVDAGYEKIQLDK